MMTGSTARLMAGVAALLPVPGNASAQDMPAPAPAPVAEQPAPDRLDEIIVYSRRRAESLQDVPIAVTAFTPESIEQRGIGRLTQLTSVIPNVIIDTQSNGPNAIRVYIRGNGSQDRNSSSDPSVGIYLDGVYLAKNRGVVLDLFDLEGVEVLRGPQGTLFGRNTTAGAILVRTRQPDLDRSSLSAEYRFGDFGRSYIRIAANLALSDKVAVNAAFIRRASDGYFHNEVTGNSLGTDNTKAFRATVLLAPDDRARLALTVDYTRIDAVPWGSIAYLPELNPNGVFGPASPVPPIRARIAAAGGITPGVTTGSLEDPFRVFQERDGRQDFEIWGFRAAGEINFANHRLEVISSYRQHREKEELDFEGTSIPLLSSNLAEDYHQVSIEAKLESGFDGPLNYTVGTLYFENRSSASQEVGTSGGPRNIFQGSSAALYGEATYELSDRLGLFAGARVVEDKRRINRVARPAPLEYLSRDASFTGWAGRAGVNFKASDSALVYGLWARGYKSGSFNFFPPAPPAGDGANEKAYRPETADSFELGLKGDLFDQRLRLNLALFYAIYTDLQVVTVDRPAAALTFLNAGRSTSSGLEAEPTAILGSGFRFTGTLGLLDAKFDNDRVVSGLKNKIVPLSSKVTGSATLNFDRTIEPIKARLTAGFTGAYRSSFANGVGANPRQYLEPGRWVTDANIGLQRGPVYTNIVARNLLDKRYYASVLPLDSLGIAPATIAEPRTFEVSIGVRF